MSYSLRVCMSVKIHFDIHYQQLKKYPEYIVLRIGQISSRIDQIKRKKKDPFFLTVSIFYY